MAKTSAMPPVPSKSKPRAHISWEPKEDLKPEGLTNAAMGKTVTVEMTGIVTGYSMDDWGCSLTVEPSAMRVAPGKGKGTVDDEGPSMVAVVKRMGTKYAKKER